MITFLDHPYQSKDMIEKKEYNSNSTEEEILAIRQRVKIHSPNVIFLKELPKMSQFSVSTIFDEMMNIAKEMDQPSAIIDIRETSPPASRVRKEIAVQFAYITKEYDLQHVAFVMGGNILINSAARFVMYHTVVTSWSIHKTLEDAEKAIKEKG